MSAKKKIIIKNVWERPTRNPAKATRQMPIVSRSRGPVRGAYDQVFSLKDISAFMFSSGTSLAKSHPTVRIYPLALPQAARQALDVGKI